MNIVQQRHEQAARSQMDLNAGMLTPGEGVVLLRFLGWCVGLATTSLWVAFLATAPWSLPLRLGGIIGFIFTLAIGYLFLRLLLASAYAHQQRLADWHEATLDAVATTPTESTVTTIAQLSVDNPRDRLAVVAWLHLSGTTPSVRNLRQRLTIERPNGVSHVGEIADAERWGKELEQRGVLVRQGQARQLAGLPLNELLERCV